MKNPSSTQTLPETGYIRLSALIPGIIPISAPTLARWIKAGQFPAPIKLGQSVSAFDVKEIKCWMEAKAAERKSV